MTKDLFILNGIIFFYVIQRLSELFISKSNESWLKENCNAIEIDPQESFRMKIFHALWFVSLSIEGNVKNSFQPPVLSLVVYLILIACLCIRLHTMEKLKRFWTIKVFFMSKHHITTDGLYRYLRHPNYLVVILELLLIPFLMKAYFTMIVFSTANYFIQKKRIQLEEETLMKHEVYQQHFTKKNRLLPFLFFFVFTFLGSNLYAAEIKKQFENYSAAKSSDEFIRFASESTKLGFITTGFDGFAKEFIINYELDKNNLKALNVQIAVKGLDTDNGSRNDKMIHEIMDGDKFPNVTGKILLPIVLSEGSREIQMAFYIKDKKIEIPVSFTVSPNTEGYIVRGHSSIKLSEAGLPNPSIAIAKVRDSFDLTFSIKLK